MGVDMRKILVSRPFSGTYNVHGENNFPENRASDLQQSVDPMRT